jgi:tetratricopeptide (TPR) repeat protein
MSAGATARLACVAVLSLTLLHAPAAPAESDAQRVFQLVAPSVVTILALDEKGRVEGQGSGVIVAAGRIVTNCHVVRDARALKVRSTQRESDAVWVTMDSSRDLCLLTSSSVDAQPVRIRRQRELAVGERVFAVGNPLGFELSVSEGLVSLIAPVRGERVLVTTAAESPGSSGGGLFDTEGQLVGITTAVMAVGQNVSLALPAAWIDELGSRGVPARAPPPAPDPEPKWGDENDALWNKDWVAVEAHARKWLASVPTSSAAARSLGMALFYLKRREESERFLRRALQNDASDSTAWGFLAFVSHDAGRTNEAEDALNRGIDLYPAYPDFQRFRAIWLRKDGRLDEAHVAIERCIALGPGDAKAWAELGRIESLRHRPEESAKAYRAALRLAPNDTATKQALATELARAGKPDKAREVLGGTGSQGAGDGATWVAIGNSAFAANRFSDAEAAYRKAIGDQLNSYTALLNLGLVLDRTGRSSEAEDAFERAIGINPDSTKAWSNLSRIQLARGDKVAALASVHRAVEADPTNAEAWRDLGNMRFAAKDYRESASAFQKIVELGKAIAGDEVHLGESLMRLGQVDAATEALLAAEKLEPENARALLGLAMLWGQRGDNKQALEYAERAVNKEPGNGAAWSSKGYALVRLGRYPEAVAAMQTAVKLAPDSSNVWINSGEALLRNGNLSQAIYALEKAVSLAPTAPDGHLFLAQAYLSSGQSAKARQEAETVLSRSPDLPPALGIVTLSLLIDGKNDDALTTFNRLKAKDASAARTLRSQAVARGLAGASSLPE